MYYVCTHVCIINQRAHVLCCLTVCIVENSVNTCLPGVVYICNDFSINLWPNWNGFVYTLEDLYTMHPSLFKLVTDALLILA